MIGKCIFAIFVTVLHLSDQLMDDFLLIADQGSAGKIWQIGINDSQVIELPTGITLMSDVVYDSSDAIVYFTAITGGLYKFKLGKNETIETILKDISGSTSSHGMSYSKTNRTLYIATYASGIHTVDVDSYDMKEFYGVETTSIWDVSVDNHHGHIYWTQENPPAIYSLGHTSVSPRTVVSLNITSPKGLYVDGPASKIYWVDSSPALVMMANLDGTGRKSLVHIPGALYTITGVNQHLFVAGPDGRLYRVANCNYTEIPVHEDMSAWGLTGYSSSPYKPVCSKCCANGGSLDIDTCECSCTGFWKGDTCQELDDFLLIADYLGKLWYIRINDSQLTEISYAVAGYDVVYNSIDNIVYTINRVMPSALYKFEFGKPGTLDVVFSDTDLLSSSHGMSYSQASRKLYIASWDHGIFTVAVDTYLIQDVYTVDGKQYWDVCVDDTNSHIYWAQLNPPSIQRLGHPSTPPRGIIEENISTPRGLYLDIPANKLYWIESEEGKVLMANLDGTERRMLVRTHDILYTITGVNQYLFVAGPNGHLFKVSNCGYKEIVSPDKGIIFWGLTGYSQSQYKPVCSKCCSHDGRLNIDTCECSCTNFWKGDMCQECGLSCDKDGVLDEESCQCLCPYQWGGRTCSECTRTCSNGGILENTKCECRCPGLWSGVTCQECNATCKNEGILDEGKCSCACAGFWTGNLCDVCDGVCENGGTIDNSTCTCACPGLWRGNTCQVCLGNCFNGGTIYDITCKCNCNQPWRGDFCSEEVDGTTTVFESPPPTDTGLLTTPFIVLLAVSSSILLILVISIIVIVVHNQKYRKQQSQKNNSPYEKGEVNYEYVEHPSDDNASPKLCNQVQGAKTDDAEVYIELDTDAGYLKPVGSDYTSIH